MNILALDTSMGACSVAVSAECQSGQSLYQAFERRSRGHAEVLMPLIKQVTVESGLAFSDIDRIAVTRGPGTFTGVRVGVAAARGLALASGVPVVSATSLAVMARHFLATQDLASLSGFDDLIVATDARRGEVYVQSFDACGQSKGRPQSLSPDVVAAGLAQRKTVAVGSGAEMIAACSANLGRDIEVRALDLLPHAAALADMAPSLEISDKAVVPLYLRPADAKPQIGKSIERLT